MSINRFSNLEEALELVKINQDEKNDSLSVSYELKSSNSNMVTLITKITTVFGNRVYFEDSFLCDRDGEKDRLISFLAYLHNKIQAIKCCSGNGKYLLLDGNIYNYTDQATENYRIMKYIRTGVPTVCMP
jgi:hypothetical protein